MPRRSLRFYVPALFALLLLVPAILLYRARVSRLEDSAQRGAFRTLQAEAARIEQAYQASLSAIAQSAAVCSLNTTCDFSEYLRAHIAGLELVARGPEGAAQVPVGFVSASGDVYQPVDPLASTLASARSYRIDLERLLRASVSSRAGSVFRNVLLVDDSGATLAQMGADPLRITSLAAYLPAPGKADRPKEEALRDDQTAPVPPAFAGSGKFPITSEGVPYFAYLQPAGVRLSGPPVRGTARRTRDIFIAGLQRRTDYEGFTRYVPLTSLAGTFTLVVGLVGMAIPVVKVLAISSRERITRRNGRFMIMLFVGSMFLIFLVYLSWGFSITLRDRTDRRLEAISNRIRDNFVKELAGALTVLHGIGPELPAIQNGDHLIRSRAAGASVVTAELRFPDLVRRKAVEPASWQQYPFFTHIAYLEDKKLVIRMMGSRKSVLPWSAAEQEAIDRFSDDTSLTLPALPPKAAPKPVNSPFRLDTIPSVSEGPTTLLTTRADGHETQDQYLQMATQLYSVVDPVMPHGFAFAIVDQQGLVKFHSDKARTNVEHFFDELDDPEFIRNLVMLQGTGFAEDRYQGVASVFYIRPLDQASGPLPLKNLNWALIVFRDHNYVEALVFGAGKVFLIGLASLLAPAFAIRALLIARSRWRRGDYLRRVFLEPNWEAVWPADRRRPHYSYVICTGGLWTVLAIFWVGQFPTYGEHGEREWKAMASFCLFAMLVATSGFWFRKFLKIRGWERMKGAAVRLLPQESLAAVYGVQVVIVVLAGLGSTALLVYNCSLNYTQYSHRYWMVQNSRIQKSEHDRRIEEIIRQREFAPGRRSDAKPASFQR